MPAAQLHDSPPALPARRARREAEDDLDAVHRYLTSVRRHDTAVIPFPEPIGPTRCLCFAESEDGWLGELPGGQAVATYGRFSPRALNRVALGINALRLMQVLPLAAFVPREK